ncbi:MAG: hypothetical protein L7V86_20735 [Verrucomicrobiales bacterium]|nr:hypothetical protein [Verrucomicrobiales bacterium]
MYKEPAEFEVLLKHVDRAGTRAVDGHEEDAPVAPKVKQLMKPEVMSPQGNPRHRSEPPQVEATGLVEWTWLISGLLLGLALTWWIVETFF